MTLTPAEKSKIRNKTKLGFNEYYTTYEQADAVLSEIKELGFLDNVKAICCPCDGADSNIVKWLQNNTKAKIVYFNYLDCNSVRAHKKMRQCECVITNPPFSMDVFMPFLQWLRFSKLKYFLWGPMPTSWGLIGKVDYFFKPKKRIDQYFIRPDGTKSTVNSLHFYTNFDVPYPDYDYVPATTEQKYKGLPFYDHVKNVPKNYDGWFYAPINILDYIKHYDVNKERSSDKDYNRYVRLCIRRKEDGTVTKITTGTSIRASRRS